MRTTIFLFTIVAITANSIGARAQSLIASVNSPNVAAVCGDTLRLVSGTTQRFIVDTPVDEGLVSTGATVGDIGEQLCGPEGGAVAFTVTDRYRQPKTGGRLATGDVLTLIEGKTYRVVVSQGALSPTLTLGRNRITAGTASDVTLDFVAGQRTGRATVRMDIPAGIDITQDNTTVDVIGRGEVSLRDLPRQSIGRHGMNYSYDRVGEATITPRAGGGHTVTLTGLDLRPANGVDVRLTIHGVMLPSKPYDFTASYSTSEPEVYHSVVTEMSTARLEVVSAVTDLRREMPREVISGSNASKCAVPVLRWTAPGGAKRVRLEYSSDRGVSWSVFRNVGPRATECTLDDPAPGRLMFRLNIEGGPLAGESNRIEVWAGMQDVTRFGAVGDGLTDDTDAINRAIEELHEAGGGILTFGKGRWMVRTVHLRSGVWLHVGSEAVIEAMPGSDAPEATWFSDRAYRSGLSPTDPAPYAEPENWLTKQDVGHTFFCNSMFFAERQENIRVFGNGRITGGGVLATGDGVMRNDPDRRADKMFTFKLCRDIEIGGYDRGMDMWYDPESDRPYYITADKERDYALENVLRIDRGGHFVLLATGTDGINVHDTCFATDDSGSARDIYDFMGCSDVSVTNIYSKVSSDDIVKLGSDCSLGFTRPASGYMVRNVIGDTNCNLFQIGSETADDISDVWVDNIYVLGSNKAGFSISTNDGARVSNIFLNTGRTGPLHSRSRMHRTRAPFFISISNRGRTLGADVQRFRFREGDRTRDELLVTNSPIGSIENIVLRDVDISDVYAGSSFRSDRWREFDGSQNRATPIIAGYALPAPERVEGGTGFTLPDGRHTGYISGIEFSGINLSVEGGNGPEDAFASPPEIGVGRYNVGDLAVQPAYGFWFRHARNVVIRDCTIACKVPDGRHAIVLDDVEGALIERVSMPSEGARPLILRIGARDVETDLDVAPRRVGELVAERFVDSFDHYMNRKRNTGLRLKAYINNIKIHFYLTENNASP